MVLQEDDENQVGGFIEFIMRKFFSNFCKRDMRLKLTKIAKKLEISIFFR